MARPVTLFTGQWADLPLTTLSRKPQSGDMTDWNLRAGAIISMWRGAQWTEYCQRQRELLAKHNLKLHAISHHLAGQLVCDPNNDSRSDGFAPRLRGRCGEETSLGGRDDEERRSHGRNLGVKVVNGFTGSSIWHLLYSFPPVSDAMIEDGFAYFAKMWKPILDVFDECGVRFALEVHPTEIAFDIVTAQRALEAIGGRKTFGFNFDPSHLHWQMVDPVRFIEEFRRQDLSCAHEGCRIAAGRETAFWRSHLNFGQPGRGWDFRSLGSGSINFEEIIRALNHIGYTGAAFGGVGGQRDGPRAWCARGVRVRPECGFRAFLRCLRCSLRSDRIGILREGAKMV